MNISGYLNKISAFQIFQVIRYGSLILISVVLVKSGISTSEIGYYESFLFIASAVSFFWLTGLMQSILPLHNRHVAGEEKSSVIFNAFLLISFLSIICGILLFLLKEMVLKINPGFCSDTYSLLILYTITSGPAFITEYVYLMKNRPTAMVVYGTLSYLAQIILVSVAVFSDAGFQYIIWALIAVNVLRIFWLLVLIVQFSAFKVSVPFIKEHVRVSYPLVLSTLLSGSAQYIDGFIISGYFDVSKFAIFRFGARELPVTMLLANAFSTAMLSEFGGKSDYEEIFRVILKKSLKLMHYLFPLTTLLLLTSHWLYPLIFNQTFKESAVIFNIYLLLIISRLVFPQTILIGMNKNKFILSASIIEIVINVGLSLVFVNFWGMAGVAYATVIAYFIEKIYLAIILKYKFSIEIRKYIPLGWLTFYIIITILTYLITELFYNYGTWEIF